MWGVGMGLGGVGVVVGFGACCRGCYGHSKPGFEIEFEITVFETTVFEVKPSSHFIIFDTLAPSHIPCYTLIAPLLK